MHVIGLAPLIRYRDVTRAVDWLCRTFGFKVSHCVRKQDGTIAYAELSCGRSLIMIGPDKIRDLDEILKQPHDIHGINTQCCYIGVHDVESHYHHASRAGAEIVLDLSSDSSGELAYIARDPEGHLWNFGSYAPWKKKEICASRNVKGSISSTLSLHQITAGIVILIILTLVFYSPGLIKKSPTSLATLSPEIVSSRVLDNQNDPTILQSAPREMNALDSKKIHRTLSANDVPLTQESLHSSLNTSPSLPTPLKVMVEDQRITSTSEDVHTSPLSLQSQHTLNREVTTSHTQAVINMEPKSPSNTNPFSVYKHSEKSVTGSLGEQSNEDPKMAFADPLPSVTVAPSVPEEKKPSNTKKTLELKKSKPKPVPPKVIPVTTKKKASPPTDLSPYFLFD